MKKLLKVITLKRIGLFIFVLIVLANALWTAKTFLSNVALGIAQNGANQAVINIAEKANKEGGIILPLDSKGQQTITLIKQAPPAMPSKPEAKK